MVVMMTMMMTMISGFGQVKMVMMATMTMMMMSGGGGQVGGDHNGLCARFAPTIHGHLCFPCLSLKYLAA